MSKPNYLLEHLLSPALGDKLSPIASRERFRLNFAYSGTRGDWSTVAGYIAGPARWPVIWFPDTNVAILQAAEPVWDALRVAGLGSTIGSTVISGVVEHEIVEWLRDPWRNKERANQIRAAMGEGTWIRRFRMGRSTSFDLAMVGYTLLLGVRRSLARPVRDGITRFGTDAADKSRTMDAIKTKIGKRALGLAKKGRQDEEKKGLMNIGDEMNCLMAIVYALSNRRDAVLLTADADYLEIFFKAQWFFDTHYRAWLAARLVKDGRYGEPAREFTDNEGYFQGPLTLYRRPTNNLHEVLPPRQRPIRVGVVYVAPNGMIHMMRFPFEPQMLDVLATRGTTDGRCTDLFGDANIHVDLGPLEQRLDGLYLGIGKDAIRTFETDGICRSLSKLDLEHSLNCKERHGY